MKALEITKISLYVILAFQSTKSLFIDLPFQYEQAEIALFTPQVAVQEHQVSLLKMENNFLNQKLASVRNPIDQNLRVCLVSIFENHS